MKTIIFTLKNKQAEQLHSAIHTLSCCNINFFHERHIGSDKAQTFCERLKDCASSNDFNIYNPHPTAPLNFCLSLREAEQMITMLEHYEALLDMVQSKELKATRQILSVIENQFQKQTGE